MARTVTKSCKGCGRRIVGHPNKRFCCQKCKDDYHNKHNPRGYGVGRDDWEQDADTVHPFSSDAFEP